MQRDAALLMSGSTIPDVNGQSNGQQAKNAFLQSSYMGFLNYQLSEPMIDLSIRSAFRIWSQWVKILTNPMPPKAGSTALPISFPPPLMRDRTSWCLLP